MIHTPFFLNHRPAGHPARVPLPPGGGPPTFKTAATGRTVWPLSRRLRPSEHRPGPITPTRRRSAADGRPAARDAVANVLRLVLFTVAAVGYVCCAAGATGALVLR